MAVAYEMRFDGATLEQYDQVMELMGLARGEPAPDGAVFHWAAKTDEGLLVVDVWETDEQFDSFAKEQIIPFTQQVGVGQPRITRHDVHNTLAGAGVAAAS
jgi:hypothetical protein